MPRDETPSYGVSISDVKGDIKGIIADRDVNLGQGNIITGDISGSYTAIGHGASVTVNQSPGSNTEALMFEAIYRQIEQRPDDPDVDKDEIVALVQSIQQEAASGAQANEKKLIRWLTTLKALAPDIFATTTTGLARADLGFAPNISQIAIQIK